MVSPICPLLGAENESDIFFEAPYTFITSEEWVGLNTCLIRGFLYLRFFAVISLLEMQIYIKRISICNYDLKKLMREEAHTF